MRLGALSSLDRALVCRSGIAVGVTLAGRPAAEVFSLEGMVMVEGRKKAILWIEMVGKCELPELDCCCMLLVMIYVKCSEIGRRTASFIVSLMHTNMLSLSIVRIV